MSTDGPTETTAAECIKLVEELRRFHDAYQQWRDHDATHSAGDSVAESIAEEKSTVAKLHELFGLMTSHRAAIQSIAAPLMDFAALDRTAYPGLQLLINGFTKDQYDAPEYVAALNDLDVIRRRLKTAEVSAEESSADDVSPAQTPTPATYTFQEMTDKIGCGDDTLRENAMQAGVRKRARGERAVYTKDEALKILDHFVLHTTTDKFKQNAKNFSEQIRNKPD